MNIRQYTLSIKSIYHKALVILGLLLGLSACSEQFSYDTPAPDEGERDVTLSLYLDQPSQTLRDVLDEETDKKITDLRLLIFNSKGKRILYKKYSTSDLSSGGNTFNGVDRGILRNITIKEGKRRFVLIANTEEGDFDFTAGGTDLLDQADTYEKLLQVRWALKDETLLRYNPMLKSGSTLETITPATTQVTIPLKRHEALVHFEINSAQGVEFEPESFRLINIPRHTFAVSHDLPTEYTPGDPMSWNASEGQANGYFSTPALPFEDVFVEPSSNAVGYAFQGGKVSFYLPESRLLGTPIPLSNDTEMDYHLRAKRVKNPDLTDTDDFQYAPQNATYVEVKGTFKKGNRLATVTYRIPLGYILSHPLNGNHKVNDYFVEGNTIYTYKIKITEVDKIIVEAKQQTFKGSEEPHSGAEGHVTDSPLNFTVDAHFEQVAFEILAKNFRALGDNEKVFIKIYTPFVGEEIITYTGQELDDIVLGRRGKVADDSKSKDLRWLWFSLNRGGQPMLRYSELTGGSQYYRRDNLFTAEQFLHKVLRDTSFRSTFRTGQRVTMFIDEYYYQCDPRQDKYYWDTMPSRGGKRRTPRDKDLWLQFCNQPPRLCSISLQYNVSKDTKSTYRSSLLSVSQLSIKTPFRKAVPAGEKLLIWGVDNIPYHKPIGVAQRVDSKSYAAAIFYNNYFKANGWINSWRWAEKGVPPSGDPKAGDHMKKRNGSDEGGLLWNSDPAKWLDRQDASQGELLLPSRYNYIQHLPFVLNRDENSDNLIQVREIKWYTPSISELSALNIVSQGLPYGNRPVLKKNIAPYRGDASVGYFASSSAYTGDAGNWVFLLLPGFSSTPHINNIRSDVYEDRGATKDQSPSLLKYNEGGLSFRVLNLDDDDAGTGPNERRTLPRNPDNDPLKFTFDHVDPICFRTNRYKGELPMHDEKSSINRIYYKGFEAAPNVESMRGNWSKIHSAILTGQSPCKNATYGGHRDWRIPNLAELTVMSYMLFDWTTHDINQYYTDLGMKKPTSIHARYWGAATYQNYYTRTIASSKQGTGYGLYIYAAASILGATSERSIMRTEFPYHPYFTNSSSFAIRCVRDLD